ncbi:immunoglobulin-like domain-containing protein [Aquimarina sp. I32.4]|uniref:immunoglobulin-like domain-containing protein n=1 Tax=Aquimarina sp. I32.4 TaxID=2053903 RepID=UPI000CDED5CA|nr:immunoglobulin-like domain-containing protein [Aquimarina sp. I32.4]
MNKLLFLSILLSGFMLSSTYAQNNVTPQTISAESTYENIGIVWSITGDNDMDSKLTIEYKASSSSTYLPTYRTMRANPNSNIDGSLLGLNHHAGSIVGLTPNTSYDIRLSITDPDGGGKTENITVTTKAEITDTYTGTIYHVIPGTGGGTGTSANPYKGLQEAANNATPGAIFYLGAGTYNSFSLATSGTEALPIVFTANLADNVVIDGANTTSGITTLGTYNGAIQHIIIENIKIQNGKWGVDAQNTQYVTVRHCTFQDVDYGYLNRRENGLEHDQTISDNYFYGRTAWPVPNGSIPSERCIDIRGNRNVVRYNLIRNFGDGVSTDGPPYKKSYALDIHNNDISYIGDDIIEVDGTIANTRIWSNKGSNGRMGVSIAPVFGGPCYVYRNEFNNMETSTYKMNRKPAGLIIVHNSAIKTGRGTSSPSGWHNTILRNNILISSQYVFEEYTIPSNSLIDDWDYNAYSSLRNGTSGQPWFKWNNVKYNQITDLQAGSGQEMNGLQFDHTTAITNISFPSTYTDGVVLGSYDFTLSASSPLINQGENIPNLNDRFVTDGSPDIGAHEYGRPLPHYGPRTASPDDTTPPIITLLGNNPQSIQQGSGYTELGATTDDGSQVIIDSSNFTDIIGTYTITYNATDNAGNVALEVTRTINVVDPVTTAPVITLIGDNPQVIQQGSGYTELGATTDDGSQVIIDSSNFTDAIGTYTITYNATDDYGNIALEVTRTVTVVSQSTTIPPDTTPFYLITYDPETNIMDIVSKEDIQDLKIYDLTGKKIKELSPNTREHQVNLEGLSDGVYVLKISNPDSNSTFKTKIMKF